MEHILLIISRVLAIPKIQNKYALAVFGIAIAFPDTDTAIIKPIKLIAAKAVKKTSGRKNILLWHDVL